MAYNNKIRKNPITNEWEHLMQIDNNSDSVWVPGLYGYYDVNSVSESLHDIYNNGNNTVIYREGLNTGIILTPISNTVLNYNEYVNTYNVEIMHLK